LRDSERRKSNQRAAQRHRDDGRGFRKFVEPSQHHHRAGDRHDLGDRHQVQSVHEVDEVDEPEPGDQQHTALDWKRTCGHDLQIGRRREDDRADGCGLQQQPRQHRNGLDVVGKSNQRDEQRRGEHHERDGKMHQAGAGARDHKRRRDHRDAGALRGRNAMRRSRVGPRQRIALEQGQAEPGDAGRHRRGQQQNQQ